MSFTIDKSQKEIANMILDELSMLQGLTIDGDFDYDFEIIPSHIKTLRKKFYKYREHYIPLTKDISELLYFDHR